MRVFTKCPKLPWRRVLEHDNLIYSQKHLFVNNMLEMVRKYNTSIEASQCRASFSNHAISIRIMRMETFRGCVVAYCEEHDVETGDTNVEVYGIGGNDLEYMSITPPA